jgi:hypothetical protein
VIVFDCEVGREARSRTYWRLVRAIWLPVVTDGSFGSLEISMKILAPAICVLSVGASLFSLPVHAQSAAITSPNFEITIQTEGERAPRYTVTNLTGKTVAACVVRLSSSLDSDTQRSVWDALVLSVPPIEPDASISQFLAHRVGGPLPDRVEVVAGVWVDGETFGDPEWVNVILKGRQSLVAAYDQAIALLREGMDQKWTREQYLQAFNDKTNSVFYGIRATLTANEDLDEHP